MSINTFIILGLKAIEFLTATTKSDVKSLHLDSKDTATKVDKNIKENTILILIGRKNLWFDS